MLAVVDLAEESGARVSPVPLFETIRDLGEAPAIVESLLDEPRFARVVEERAGGSRSWSATRTRGRTAATSPRSGRSSGPRSVWPPSPPSGIELTIFHGRGGSTWAGRRPDARRHPRPAGRPPARAPQADRAGRDRLLQVRPAGAAYRNLEAALAATLLAAFPEVAGSRPPEGARETLEALSAAAFAAYRGLVWEDERFVEFFRSFTPIEELALLEIGSRPARRPEGGELSAPSAPSPGSSPGRRTAASSRPGTAAARLRGADVAELRRLYGGWAFFRSLVENLEMTLAKSSLEIAAGYLDLVEDVTLYEPIRAEHERTVASVLEIVEARELLDRHPVIQRSIRLRNPYVDPMNAIQVELLAAGARPGTRRSSARSCARSRASRQPSGTPATVPGYQRRPRAAPTSSRLARLWPLAKWSTWGRAAFMPRASGS